MSTKSLIICFVIALVLATISYGSYDLASYDNLFSTTAAAAATARFSFGQLNPTFGSKSTIAIEFTATKRLGSTHSFLGHLPGFEAEADFRAKVCKIVGTTETCTEFRTWNQITGEKAGLPSSPANILNFLEPRQRNTDCRFSIWNELDIEVGHTVRIIIEGARAPLRFNDWNDKCKAAFERSTPTDFTVEDDDCCKQFTLNILAGSAVRVGGIIDSAATAEISLTAKICPNYGSLGDAYAPQVCLSTPPSGWSVGLTNLCCQYPKFASTDACRDYRCANGDWSFTSENVNCCHVEPHINDSNGHELAARKCPLCSNANFITGKCCDRFSTNPIYQEFYKNDARCDVIFCRCEDWTPDRCCFKFGDSSPFYEHNGQKCPTCESTTSSDWNPICCRLEKWRDDAKCICTNEFYLPDVCCKTTQWSPLYCPIDPNCPPEEDQSSDCGCDCDEEPSCPCAFFANGNGDGNADGTQNTYLKYDKHLLDANNITSGHNTILINHLHVDTHIDINNEEDCEKLKELLPAVLFNLNSGGHDGILPHIPTPLEIAQEIKDKIKDDLSNIKDAVKDVAQDVKQVTTDVVHKTTDVVKNTVGNALNTIGGGHNGVGGGVGTVITATMGKPVRQICTIKGRKSPLSSLQLITLRLLIQAQLALVGLGNGCQVNFITQFAAGVGVGINNNVHQAADNSEPAYSITYDVSQGQTTQEELAQKLNSANSGLTAAISKSFDSDVTITQAQAVAGSNECSTDGKCTSSCRCAFGFTCDKDEQCLSEYCDPKSKVCMDKNNSSTIAYTTSMIIVIMGMIAMVF